MNVEATAKYLITHKFPISQYIKVQEQRRKRLQQWRERKIAPLIKAEMELIAGGEKVLRLMEKAYDGKN